MADQINMKVHITLKNEVLATKTTVLAAIQDNFTLTDINQNRFERHGIITGNIPQDEICRLSVFEGVKSVSIDEMKNI